MGSLVPGKKITMEGEEVISQALGSALWIVGVEQGEAESNADSHKGGRMHGECLGAGGQSYALLNLLGHLVH